MQRVETVYVTPAADGVDPEWDSPGSYHRTRACAAGGEDSGVPVLEKTVREAEAEGYRRCGRCLG